MFLSLRVPRIYWATLVAGLAIISSCSSPPPPAQARKSKLTTHRHHTDDHKQPKHGAMTHRFEDADKWAKKFDDPKRDQWQQPDQVVKALSLTPNMTVVDIGAGTGYFLPHLSHALGEKGHVIGLDIETSMVDYMAKRIKDSGLANASSKKGEPNDPLLAFNSIDRILVVDTWHHIQNRPAYVKKLYDGLKPNGMVAIVDFNKKSPIGPPKHHRLTPSQVQSDFPESTWNVSEAKTTLPYQFIVIAQKQQNQE